jgi:hypothetical protein
MPDDKIARMWAMIAEAGQLAADDNVLIRVAGERICAILADVLYEVDTGADEVIPFMPHARRTAPASRSR